MIRALVATRHPGFLLGPITGRVTIQGAIVLLAAPGPLYAMHR
jgi:hypothetical protein